jgi:hypothetical protein
MGSSSWLPLAGLAMEFTPVQMLFAPSSDRTLIRIGALP